MEQVKSVLELMHCISHMAVATEVGTSPASVYHILTNTLGNENFVHSGFHMWSTLTKESCMFYLSPPICCIGEMEAVHSQSHFNSQQVIVVFV
jgi:hypothetical protein